MSQGKVMDEYVGTFRIGERGDCFEVLRKRTLSFDCQYVDRWADRLWRGKEFRLGIIALQQTQPWPHCVECKERPVRPNDYLCQGCRRKLYEPSRP